MIECVLLFAWKATESYRMRGHRSLQSFTYTSRYCVAMFRAWCQLQFIGIFGFVPLHAQEVPENYALMIAIDNYQQPAMNEPKLRFTVDDARAVGKRFEDSNYIVEYLINGEATKADIEAKLSQLRDRNQNAGGIVVIGLFGHGTELETTKVSYFCPYDAKLVPIKNRKQQHDISLLVSFDRILDEFRSALAEQRVLLADCCRFDPNSSRSVGSSLNAGDLPTDTNVFLACRSGQKAYENTVWGDENSPGHGAFTKSLLDSMTKYSQLGSIAQDVTPKVKELVDNVRLESDLPQVPYLFINGGIIDLRLKLKLAETSPHFTSSSVGMEFVLLPAGKFKSASVPSRELALASPIYIGTREVTQAEFSLLMKFNPSEFGTDSHPVERVKWCSAIDFCNRLSERDGIKPYYDLSNTQYDRSEIVSCEVSSLGGFGYRLPTEAEWEYACSIGKANRGGEQAISDLAWYSENSAFGGQRSTQCVGTKLANANGCFDLLGNVWEWCDGLGHHKPCRGGSWMYPEKMQAATSRATHHIGESFADVGFRVVRTVEP